MVSCYEQASGTRSRKVYLPTGSHESGLFYLNHIKEAAVYIFQHWWLPIYAQRSLMLQQSLIF